MKKLLIATGGGDCPGLNAVIRAVVHRAGQEDDWEVLQVRPRKKKAKTQGYDDRKDESLGMSRGKTASKDLDGTKKEKEKSRRDDAGFETRKKRGRKKHIYSWKPEAKGKVPISALKKTPSEYYAKKFPNLVNLEKQ